MPAGRAKKTHKIRENQLWNRQIPLSASQRRGEAVKQEGYHKEPETEKRHIAALKGQKEL